VSYFPENTATGNIYVGMSNAVIGYHIFNRTTEEEMSPMEGVLKYNTTTGVLTTWYGSPASVMYH
jgi:hypothetical protein